MGSLKIGALAERTGTNAPTIRYYEEIGLLRSADRQSGGQRVYGDGDVKRLTFIRRCREFGFQSTKCGRSLRSWKIHRVPACTRVTWPKNILEQYARSCPS